MTAKQAATRRTGKGRRGKETTAALAAKRRAEVLNHPWRIRILEVLSERDMCCAQIVDEGLIPELVDLPRENAISDLAYHFRVLKEADVIEVVGEIRRRGGIQMVCRLRVPAYYTDEEWAQLAPNKRRPISEMVLESLVARARGAMAFDTFDLRDDRHLTSLPMELDEEGWSELADAMAAMLGTVIQIRHDARERLAASGESAVRVTYGQLGFQSAPLPPPLDE